MLHTIAMFMKQHSYMSCNRELADKTTRLKELRLQLIKLQGTLKKKELDSFSMTKHMMEEVEDLDAEIEELKIQCESGGTGIEGVKYPENVTLKNFVDYLLVPTLVYECEYPRTGR